MKFHLNRRTPISYLIVAIILLLLPCQLSSYGLSILIQIFIYAIFAMSLNLLVGYTGLVSLGHAAFFGVGAYTAAVLTTNEVTNFLAVLGAGIFTSFVAALFFGILVINRKGAVFLMLTLALGQMLFVIAWQWRSLLGGDDGLPGIPRPDFGPSLSMWNTTNFYYLIMLFFIAFVILFSLIVSSQFGKGLLGIRESERRMQALGYNTWLYKYTAYVLAGSFAGLAGVLFVYFNGIVSPNELSGTLSALALLMVIIGGAGTIAGPIVGSATILLLQNVVSSYTERWSLIMGVIFIICVMYFPEGMIGSLKLKMRRGGALSGCSNDYESE